MWLNAGARAEIPLPTALARKGFGQIRQIRRFASGEITSASTRSPYVGAGFRHRPQTCSRVIPGNSSVRLATRERTECNPFRRKFLLSIQIVRQTAEVGVQQQRTVMETAILVSRDRLNRRFLSDRRPAFWYDQIVASRRRGHDPQRIQRRGAKYGCGDGFIVFRFTGHKGKSRYYRGHGISAPPRRCYGGPDDVNLFPYAAYYTLPRVLRASNHHRIRVAPPQEQHALGGGHSWKMHPRPPKLNQWIVRVRNKQA